MNRIDSHHRRPPRRSATATLLLIAGATSLWAAASRATADVPATMPTPRSFDLVADPVPAAPGPAPATGTPVSASSGDTRYGPFDLLDRRSRYGTFWFPEPLRIDEVDVDNEVRVDWHHDQGKGTVANQINLELEKAFGLVTLELEVPYVVETEAVFDPLTLTNRHQDVQGVGNVEVSARAPFFQYVSRDGSFDNTIGFGFELGIPTNSPVSKTTELVPKVFDALRIGDHFSVQTLVGLSYQLGSKSEGGGTRTLEYGIVFGYELPREQLPLPFVEQTIPLFELVGETSLNSPTYGGNTLTGTVGARFNLESIGALQPRVGLGYVFPIDKGGRDELRQGFVLSLVFEY